MPGHTWLQMEFNVEREILLKNICYRQYEKCFIACWLGMFLNTLFSGLVCVVLTYKTVIVLVKKGQKNVEEKIRTFSVFHFLSNSNVQLHLFHLSPFQMWFPLLLSFPLPVLPSDRGESSESSTQWHRVMGKKGQTMCNAWHFLFFFLY